MKLDYYSSTSLRVLKQAIDERNSEGQFQAHIVLTCDANNWPEVELQALLRSQEVGVFGALFPQIIFNHNNYDVGFILASFQQDIAWQLVANLSSPEEDYDDPVSEAAQSWEEDENESTILVFADGMSSRIAALIESLFFNFGLERNFVGGGAGSLSFEKKPCILCPDGFLQDVALLLRLPMLSGIGVAHGWQPVSESLKVTQSDQNVILQLDYEDAFSQYKAVVDYHSGQNINAQNFFDIAKSFPFGIEKLDSEMIVRDPLMPTEDGKGLVCVGEVPEECFVKILKGTPDDLLQAAATVRERAWADWHQKHEGHPQAGLFIDCISRVLFLEEKMAQEITQVSGSLPLFGALTLGEIANNGQDYLEFYNKTAVLCVIGDV